MTQPAQQFIDAAQAAQRRWKVPASISLAQWALESGWGKHDLGCFNYFGMKAPCDAAGHPLTAHVDVKTREVDRYGHDYYITAPFRKFASPEEAFEEHAKLLATKPVYAKAMAAPDPDAFADALIWRGPDGQTHGYATDPNYAKSLHAIMHGSNLYQYDGPRP